MKLVKVWLDSWFGIFTPSAISRRDWVSPLEIKKRRKREADRGSGTLFILRWVGKYSFI